MLLTTSGTIDSSTSRANNLFYALTNTQRQEIEMQRNQQVTGNYMGVDFRGVIAEMRSLTVKTDGAFEYMVTLAEPITVFGTERNSLCLCAKFDGTPSSYTKYTDSLSAAA